MSTTRRPNILVILSDDHAQWASHCYGNSEIKTPNMDYLAETGLLMQNAYTPCPVCSPARASFFTGRLPSQHGIQDFLASTPEYDHDWMRGETTLPEILKENGYQTGLIGKWHCTTDSVPPQPGFDRWLSYDSNPKGWRNQYLHRGPVYLSDDGKKILVDDFQSRFFSREAIRFLRDRDRGRPFFLFFGLVDTHFPFIGHPDRWAHPYREAHFWDIPVHETNSLYEPSNNVSEVEMGREEALAQYYSAVSMIDDEVGILLDELNGSGDLDNTLLLYTADHGHMNGHHGLWGKGNASRPQNFFEESIRIPCLLRWPEGLPPRRQPSIPFDHCDMLPTLLDAAQVKLGPILRSRINSPGYNLLRYLNDPETGWRDYQFCEYGPARMITDTRVKLIRRYPPHKGVYPDEFYHLPSDPRETRNLINEPEWEKEISRLTRLLDDHFTRYETPQHSIKRILQQPPCNGSDLWWPSPAH